MDRMMEHLTQRMAALMGNQNQENPNLNPNPNPDQEESGEKSEGENYFADIPRRQQRGLIEDDGRRWESGMRTEIPEYHGSLKPEEFLDWLATIEEILKFKGVPEDKRVPLVAIRLRDRTTTWWQQESKDPIFDGEEVVDEEVVTGDTRKILVVRRSRLAPKVADDNWLRHNIFQSTCTVLGKVCRFVIDAGSCENIVSIETVQKLGLKTDKHPKPYKLAWLKKGGEVTISQRTLVSFSIGVKYKDVVWCSVVAMDACHLLLERPWQYDCRVIHDGWTNSYNFVFENVKIVLMPSRETEKPTSMGGETKLLSLARFEEELDESQLVYVLIGNEVGAEVTIPTAAASIVAEFIDVFPDELPDGLPPLRDIQHQIVPELRAALPNRPHYRMSPGEHEELRR
ncbi:hypothetical protein CRG98_020769 [Punica granatum]|uniref:Retrotransposon gag domain-containing protein n=1 Tax=Punica granatum TaxID=22663 RepID=A0A2I0JSK1_PUNGR|nr:hypothetical protein CRG98_020769 [Punica granatum]